MVRILLIVFFLLISSCSRNDKQASLIVDPSRDRSFSYEVFLPSNDSKQPLIVFSHGSGGDYQNYNWLIESLVLNGYVVATLNHPYNNALDNTDKGVIRVWDRPRDISLLIDTLLANPQWLGHIDSNRISVAGHSSGGYTAIALGGAIYNPALMRSYCSGNERGPDCDLANSKVTIDYSNASISYKDDRIKSIVALAPAVGPAIDQASLESINIPVLVIATKDDEVLNIEKHAMYYAKNIPDSQFQLLSGGGHFIYMECNIITRVADFFIDNLDLCGSQFKVDRDSVREKAASIIIKFFNANIGE